MTDDHAPLPVPVQEEEGSSVAAAAAAAAQLEYNSSGEDSLSVASTLATPSSIISKPTITINTLSKGQHPAPTFTLRTPTRPLINPSSQQASWPTLYSQLSSRLAKQDNDISALRAMLATRVTGPSMHLALSRMASLVDVHKMVVSMRDELTKRVNEKADVTAVQKALRSKMEKSQLKRFTTALASIRRVLRTTPLLQRQLREALQHDDERGNSGGIGAPVAASAGGAKDYESSFGSTIQDETVISENGAAFADGEKEDSKELQHDTAMAVARSIDRITGQVLDGATDLVEKFAREEHQEEVEAFEGSDRGRRRHTPRRYSDDAAVSSRGKATSTVQERDEGVKEENEVEGGARETGDGGRMVGRSGLASNSPLFEDEHGENMSALEAYRRRRRRRRTSSVSSLSSGDDSTDNSGNHRSQRSLHASQWTLEHDAQHRGDTRVRPSRSDHLRKRSFDSQGGLLTVPPSIEEQREVEEREYQLARPRRSSQSNTRVPIPIAVDRRIVSEGRDAVVRNEPPTLTQNGRKPRQNDITEEGPVGSDVVGRSHVRRRQSDAQTYASGGYLGLKAQRGHHTLQSDDEDEETFFLLKELRDRVGLLEMVTSSSSSAANPRRNSSASRGRGDRSRRSSLASNCSSSGGRKGGKAGGQRHRGDFRRPSTSKKGSWSSGSGVHPSDSQVPQVAKSPPIVSSGVIPGILSSDPVTSLSRQYHARYERILAEVAGAVSEIEATKRRLASSQTLLRDMRARAAEEGLDMQELSKRVRESMRAVQDIRKRSEESRMLLRSVERQRNTFETFMKDTEKRVSDMMSIKNRLLSTIQEGHGSISSQVKNLRADVIALRGEVKKHTAALGTKCALAEKERQAVAEAVTALKAKADRRLGLVEQWYEKGVSAICSLAAPLDRHISAMSTQTGIYRGQIDKYKEKHLQLAHDFRQYAEQAEVSLRRYDESNRGDVNKMHLLGRPDGQFSVISMKKAICAPAKEETSERTVSQLPAVVIPGASSTARLPFLPAAVEKLESTRPRTAEAVLGTNSNGDRSLSEDRAQKIMSARVVQAASARCREKPADAQVRRRRTKQRATLLTGLAVLDAQFKLDLPCLPPMSK